MNCSKASQSDASVPPVHQATGLRGIVLIVTADDNFSAAASRVLQPKGYEVVTAPHAGHGILAALTRTRIDVLITETDLDDMAGERLAMTLRRYHPQLRSLFIAEHATPGRGGVLVRPFNWEELLVELNETAPATVSQAS